MTATTAAGAPALRLEIDSGASEQLVLRTGATVICASGSVIVQEWAHGCQTADGLHWSVSARVNAGESFDLAYGGAVRLTGIGRAQVICLDAPSRISRVTRWVSGFLQKILAKNRAAGLNALHKISK